MGPQVTFRRWLFLLVPFCGLAELAAQAWIVARAPNEAQYDKLGEVVRELSHPGDPVVVVPRYLEPHMRKVLGPAFFPLRTLGRSRADTFGSAIEVSLDERRSPELEGFVEEAQRDSGRYTVRKLTNPHVVSVTYDFVDHTNPGSLRVERTDPPTSCAFSTTATPLSGGLAGHPTLGRERFVCPPNFFFDVSVTVIADQDFLPRRCIFAHPSDAGDLVLQYRDVPLGSQIVGHSGLYWVMERDRQFAPVDLELRIEGEVVGAVRHHDGDGFAPFEFDLGKYQKARARSVEFRIRSEDPLHRHYCFEAVSR